MRGALCNNPVLFADYIDALGNCFQDTQIMRGCHDRFPGLSLPVDEINQPGNAARVQSGRGLIQQPDIR